MGFKRVLAGERRKVGTSGPAREPAQDGAGSGEDALTRGHPSLASPPLAPRIA